MTDSVAGRLRPGRLLPGLGLALALSGAGAPLAAQEMRDSLQNVVRERLERLTRRLGDTTGLVPIDSVDNNLGEVATSDSTLMELLALPGYDLVQYRGQAATFETASRLLTLYGSDGTEAVMNREGLELAADSALVFNETTGRLVTIGDTARYRPDQGDEVVTRRIIFDLNEDRGTASDVNTTMDAGLGEWIVRGDFPWVNADVSFGHDVMFTSCDEEEPHYHFVAREIKMTEGGTLVARNVLLYFADVGVMWLPFIAQSTEQGRRSGLLPIRFSVNDIVRTSGSYARRLSNVGYYWAINDYLDAQLSMDWWSGNYTAVTGGTQFRWLRQFMDSNINFRQFWRTNGASELAFDAGYNWEISERTKLRLAARYASSASFVRQNSFDPREVTQSIDSDGGFNRRFDFGTLSLSANRRQFLSDDRVEMTLPTANFSLSTITLFAAPPNRARFYNNATVSGSLRLARAIRDLPAPMITEEQPFTLAMADEQDWRGGASASLSAGNISISQSVEFNRNTKLDLPGSFFDPMMPAQRAGLGSVADLQRSIVYPHAAQDEIDFTAENVTWSTSINYQQTLVGSTTITPQISLSGRSVGSDTLSAGGGGFVSAPSRFSLGAQLKSDFYGFFLDGTLRHKVSPTFDYAYTPEATPSALQTAIFGNRAIQPKNEIRFGLTQTFEMKVGDEEADSAAAETAAADPSGGPRRLPQAQKVTVLALRSSAVTYDFEQASELGHFTRGFADNLRVSHQISSDYLRGLTVSLEHLVFDDVGIGPQGARSFSPFISNLNLGFSMGSQTALFRWLRGLTGGEVDEEGDAAQAGQTQETQDDQRDPAGFETEDLGESTIVPGGGRERAAGPRRQQGDVGKWDASFSYSLARDRGMGATNNQMLQGTLNFQPTEKWSVRWRTSYDVVAGVFNDHMISLQRDMHRWEADFSFRQTATGNWTFLFEVALSDNRDLHFDYEQRTGGAEGR